MMLCSISSVYAAHARVEAAAQNGCKSCLLEALLVCPLPAVLKVSLVLRLIVCGVEIVASASQAGIHYGKVLIRQGKVDNQLGLIVVEQSLELLNVVGVNLRRLYIHVNSGLVDGVDNLVALLLTATCNHELGKHVSVLCYLERCNGSYATGSNH